MESFDTVQRVDVGGRSVAFRAVGDGPPVVLIHGWPLCSQTWRKVVPGLASEYRCVALDLLGAGETAAPDGASLRLAAQGELVAGFLDALGLDRVALVGHDSGGSVARAFAIANPQRVSQLILADTEVPGHRPPFVTAAIRLSALPGARSFLASALRSRRLSRLVFRPFFADIGGFRFDEFFEAVIAPNVRSRVAADGTFRFLRDFDFDEVDDAEAEYAKLDMPKLVLWGEGDWAFPIKEGRRLADQLPEPVRFEAVPDAGLFVHEEAPDAWIERVRSFLDSHDG